jgi:DNA-binding Lrp family transcriptional regulator
VADTRARVDDVDRQLLDHLLADGRISMAALAERVHISRANAYNRVSRLQDAGVIRGYGAKVDPNALGLGLCAMILVTVDQRRWRELPPALAEIPGVVYQAAATGDFDHLLIVRVPDMATLHDVVLERLHDLPEVRSTKTAFLLEEHGEPS